jgi:D-alanyl-D-alanine carboxypeptidase
MNSKKTKIENSVEGILRKEVKNNQTPSVHYVFFDQENIITEYRIGYSELNNKLEVNQNNTFNAYSITKTFTALSVLQLAEKKLVDINKPIRHYLPDMELSEEITVKQLLAHTSGLANPIPLKWIHLKEEHDSFNPNDFFDPLLKKYGKPKTKPGTKFKYSNLGYIVLGQLIETVTGMTYEQYVTENVINKLGIPPHELGFTIDNEALHVKGYHAKNSFTMLLLGLFIDKDKYMDKSIDKWKPFRENYVNGASYGGLIGTTNSFVRYGQALLRDSNVLISKEYKELLFMENKTADNKPSGMCLSWFKSNLNGITYYTHAGGGGGYYCEIRLYPEIEAGSFIIFNRSGFSDERFLDKTDQLLLQEFDIGRVRMNNGK